MFVHLQECKFNVGSYIHDATQIQFSGTFGHDVVNQRAQQYEINITALKKEDTELIWANRNYSLTGFKVSPIFWWAKNPSIWAVKKWMEKFCNVILLGLIIFLISPHVKLLLWVLAKSKLQYIQHKKLCQPRLRWLSFTDKNIFSFPNAKWIYQSLITKAKTS